jgi:hypothetical protein
MSFEKFLEELGGSSTNKLSNEKFTILIALNKGSTTISDDDCYLLSIPGNDKYAFEIRLKDNYLHLICDGNDYKSTKEIIIYNKGLLAIVFNSNVINVFHDGINVLSVTIRKSYFNDDKIIVNKIKIWI